LVSVPSEVGSLISTAVQQYDAAQKKLKTGDFAGYGAATRELEATLNKLQSMTAGRAGATPPAR
jgi:hypothetical protein